MLRCPVGLATFRSASDPLVGDLEALGFEPTDQWIVGGRHTKTARGSSSRPTGCRCFLRGCPGSTRYSIRSPGLLGAVLPLRFASLAGGADHRSGGDEETRTPDPLLAKEMLFQLSYVPLPDRRRRLGEWWAFLDSNQRPLPYQGSALTS